MEQSFSFISSDSKEAYFLCFTKTDLFRVKEIVEDLRRYNLELSYLTGDVKDREEQIAIRIQNSKGVLFFVSKNVLSTDDTDLKTQYEMAAYFLEKPVYPIILDDVKDADVSETLFGWWVELNNKTCIKIPTAFTIIHALNIETNLKTHESVSASSISDLGDQYAHYSSIQDYANAVIILKKLADMGNAIGQNDLGHYYQMGFGVEQNDLLAFKYYRMAAEQDFAMAQNNLGMCYLDGIGTPQDYQKAIYFLKIAADKGLDLALYNLGRCYLLGLGVPQSYKMAIKSLELPAAHGMGDAQVLIGSCYIEAPFYCRNTKKGIAFLQTAAEKGVSSAEYYLGTLYYSGQGVKKDGSQAFNYFSRAAEHGDADAMAYLCFCYADGFGVSQDDRMAEKYLRLSVEKNSPLGQFSLGTYLLDGECTEEEYEEAIRLLRLSAQQDWEGQSEAANLLKKMGAS